SSITAAPSASSPRSSCGSSGRREVPRRRGIATSPGSDANGRSRSSSFSTVSAIRAVCATSTCCGAPRRHRGRQTHPVVRPGFKPVRGRQTHPGRFDSCCLPPLGIVETDSDMTETLPEAPRLTSLSHGGGCGCKIAPAVLAELISGIAPATPFAGLLVGTETSDDAAVYRLNDEQAV